MSSNASFTGLGFSHQSSIRSFPRSRFDPVMEGSSFRDKTKTAAGGDFPTRGLGISVTLKKKKELFTTCKKYMYTCSFKRKFSQCK